MDQKYIDRFSKMSDRELIERILAKPCDGYAADYLILEKYSPLLRVTYNDLYNSNHDYFDDCKSELKMYLMGKDLSWSRLAGIEKKDSINAWLGKTAYRLFKSIKPRLIGFSSKPLSLDDEEPGKPKLQLPVNVESLYDDLESFAIVTEAITMLDDDDRMCIWMDMKGYSQKEIAEMLRAKWAQEGTTVKSSKKDGGIVTPNARYVNVRLQRARKEILKYYNKVYNVK